MGNTGFLSYYGEVEMENQTGDRNGDFKYHQWENHQNDMLYLLKSMAWSMGNPPFSGMISEIWEIRPEVQSLPPRNQVHYDTSWYIMIHHDTSWYIRIHENTILRSCMLLIIQFVYTSMLYHWDLQSAPGGSHPQLSASDSTWCPSGAEIGLFWWGKLKHPTWNSPWLV